MKKYKISFIGIIVTCIQVLALTLFFSSPLVDPPTAFSADTDLFISDENYYLAPFPPLRESDDGDIDPLPAVSGSSADYLEGNLSVDESGGAIYSIDLQVPPGTAGLAPTLDLVYNSNGSDASLGIGWSLKGLSAITRCSTTIAQDGIIDGVDFDSNDKFCLDGQRLVVISGSYGGNGSEYRTESEIFSRIYSYGRSGGGPAHWLVQTKNGLIYKYGTTGDSRVEAAGRSDVLLWQLARVEDTLGNFFSVSYFESTSSGESYPSRIDYTGNDSQSLTPYNSIFFDYENRPVAAKRYIGGSVVTIKKRLAALRMMTSGSLAWRYLLSYETDSLLKSRLRTVTQCAGDGTCLNPTSFVWKEGVESFANPVRWFRTTGSKYNNYPEWSSSFGVKATLIDMNGDGLADRVSYVNYITGEGNGFWVALNTGSGFSSPQKWFSAAGVEEENYPKRRVSDGIRSDLIDMNADGLPDRVSYKNYITGEENGFWVALNTGSGFSSPQKWFSTLVGSHNNNYPQWVDSSGLGIIADLLDMNGDGLPDRISYRNFLTGEAYGLWVAINTGSGFNDPEKWLSKVVGEPYLDYPQWTSSKGVKAKLIDMNGDGLPDRVSYKNRITGEANRFWVSINTGSGFNDPVAWFTDTSSYYNNYPQWVDSTGFGVEADLVDMNDDGLPDRISHRNYTSGVEGSFWVALNTGTGFENPSEWFSASGTQYNNYPTWRSSKGFKANLVDINDDGFPDRISFKNFASEVEDKFWVALNTGSGFKNPDEWYSAADSEHNNYPYWVDSLGFGVIANLVDVTGDGLLDRVSNVNHITGEEDSFWVAVNRGTDSAIEEIVNGLGSRLTIEYKPLTDKSIYTKYTDAQYPALDLQFPMNVVSAYSQENGLGGRARITYKYEGLKIVQNGRGFCGFRKISSTDATTGIKTTTLYRQDHPFKSFPTSTESVLSDGTVIMRTNDTWEAEYYPGGRYFTYISESIEEEFELDGSLVKSFTTTKVHDNFGNVTELTTTSSDAHITRTVNTYDSDTTKWFLDRLIRSEVTKTAPGESPLTRVSGFSYDSATGLLLEETEALGQAALEMKKSYTHDSFGNIISSTMSAPSLDSRTSTTVYDSRGQFAERSINPLGHTEVKDYDSRYGKLSAITDPNGLRTEWTYDTFGKRKQESRADGTETRVLRFLAESGAPTLAVYYERTDSSGAPPRITYYDILGREIRKQAISFDGRSVFTDKEYNNKRELIRESDPYFEGDIPVWTEYEYDELGRVTKITAPGNRITATSYDGLTRVVVNPLSQETTRIYNAISKLIESRDNLGGSIQYSYDSFGNLIRTQDPLGNVTSMQYDLVGNRTQINDPDSGIITSRYDAFGQLVNQLDAKGNEVVFDYDKLGRLISRSETEGTSLWEYDIRNMGIGKLASEASPSGYLEEYFYDDFGRITSTLMSVAGEDFTVSQLYDQYGRIKNIVYPNGFAIQKNYNSYGFLSEVSNAHSLELYYRVNELNARGDITSESYGNGLNTFRNYNAETAYLEKIETPSVQDLGFSFDAIGNVKERTDISIDTSENFEYDGLNRLIKISTKLPTGTSSSGLAFSRSSVQIRKLSYDALGNILTKTGVGNYTYGENGAGPHALTSISGLRSNTYSYDANGNRVGDMYGVVDYTSFNKPSLITKNESSLEFLHKASRSRFAQITREDGVLQKTKLYIGQFFEREESASSTKETHFIPGAGSTIAVYTRETAKPDKLRYLHKDHLNSIQSITDEIGHIVEILSFDAWGKRREANWIDSELQISSEVDRGFTGHEQLDVVGLIHMNGRVYDPLVGRFLSPDPVVQAPENTQSLNRYSYVLNNPLSYSDPSGFLSKKVAKKKKELSKKNKNAALGASSSSAFLATAGWAPGFSAVLLGGVTSHSPVLVAGGSSVTSLTAASVGTYSDIFKAGYRGGLLSGASARFAISVAQETGHKNILVIENPHNKTAYGLSGGLYELSQGGKFEHGFISVPYARSLSGSPGKAPASSTTKVAASATIGGVSTELSGGKFANGAATSAFAELFKGESAESEFYGEGFVLTDRWARSAESSFNSRTLQMNASIAASYASAGLHYINYQLASFNNIVSAPFAAANYYSEGTLDAIGQSLMVSHPTLATTGLMVEGASIAFAAGSYVHNKSNEIKSSSYKGFYNSLEAAKNKREAKNELMRSYDHSAIMSYK